jgi:DNA-binding CsgD family transcriptional regulator
MIFLKPLRGMALFLKMIDQYKLRKNHKFLSSAGLVNQICAPLQYFKIHLFTYLKKFNDGSEINLSTDPRWIFDYYYLALYRTSMYESEHHKTGISIWPVNCPSLVFQHGREHFDSVYGFTLCQEQEDSCEFFFFSLSSKHYKMLDVCINNLDLIEEFTLYFKERASELLKSCDSQRIIIPNNLCQQKTDLLYTSNYLREKFTQAIKRNSFTKWLRSHEPLTKREAECLDLLIDFQTVPELAKELNISKRTVETHLERIKAKLKCQSKQELLIKIAHFSCINK